MRIPIEGDDYEEEENSVAARYISGKKAEPVNFPNKPLFAYNYIVLNDNFGFCSAPVIKEYYEKYFQKVKEYSTKSIVELESLPEYEKFRINDGTRADKTIIEEFKKHLRLERPTPNQFPAFGHFHLYNATELRELHRRLGIDNVCPVVHFFITGHVFHTFLFDVCHMVHQVRR